MRKPLEETPEAVLAARAKKLDITSMTAVAAKRQSAKAQSYLELLATAPTSVIADPRNDNTSS